MNTDLTLTSTDFASLSPLLILLVAALIVLTIESFSSLHSKTGSFFVTMGSLIAALLATLYAPMSSNPLLTPWLRFDSLSYFFNFLFLTIGLGSTLLSSPFLKKTEATHGEYYFLLLSSIFGLLLIGSAADFLTMFIGLETLSISLYILCGYIKSWDISHESAIKYFIMGAVATAILVYGIALIYGAIGSTRFDTLLGGYQSLTTSSSQALFLSGIALITLGLAFKAAVVPFHAWAPDVYSGAPTPITAFMAVGTKAGAFAALIIIFLQSLPRFNLLWNESIALLAYPTLIYANLVALRQTQLRRFFAYSGIAHAGFLLIPLAAGTQDAIQAIAFYLVVYSLATLGCFAVLTILDHRKEGVVLQDLYGLFRRSPFLASLFALCLLTLAGIPPTAGFLAKFYAFKVAFEAGYYGLVILGLITTVIAAFYYLRFISAMLVESTTESIVSHYSYQATTVGIIALIGIVTLSIYPTALLALITIY